MKNKLLNAVTLLVIIVIVSCTFLSNYLYEKNTINVVSTEPMTMVLCDEEYYLVVPSSAVHMLGDEAYVNVIKTRKGLIKEEQYLKTVPVSILAEENNYTALGGRNIAGRDRIVIAPKEELHDGTRVRE